MRNRVCHYCNNVIVKPRKGKRFCSTTCRVYSHLSDGQPFVGKKRFTLDDIVRVFNWYFENNKAALTAVNNVSAVEVIRLLFGDTRTIVFDPEQKKLVLVEQ